MLGAGDEAAFFGVSSALAFQRLKLIAEATLDDRLADAMGKEGFPLVDISAE